MPIATGEFDVALSPQPSTAEGVSRMSLDKQFKGDLQASSVGEMLAVRTEVQGSAGYVAMERVTGSLHGRTGSFALQHHGLMARGEPTLLVTVVPDSGTGALQGLSGAMQIIIEDGRHGYRFDYALADTSD